MVRRLPVVNTIAGAWWRRTQALAFWAAFNELEAPRTTGARALSRSAVDIPSPDEIHEGETATVEAGNDFSVTMMAWGSTSKWVHLGYQDVYARVLRHLRGRPIRLLEVGIGVNDPRAPSGMASTHLPGASLTAWSMYFESSEAHGADIDPRVLVDTDRYRTHLVDQRSDESLRQLANTIGRPIDLVVDDGLHTPEANARTVTALLPSISRDGVLAVEDIHEEFGFLWRELSSRLRGEYRLVYYSAAVLRQNRAPGSEVGMAIFTRAV